MKKTTKLSPDFFRKIGKKGGKATLKKYGDKHFGKLGKKMWKKRNEAVVA